jgi:hypothetical protein
MSCGVPRALRACRNSAGGVRGDWQPNARSNVERRTGPPNEARADARPPLAAVDAALHTSRREGDVDTIVARSELGCPRVERVQWGAAKQTDSPTRSKRVRSSRETRHRPVEAGESNDR